MAFIKGPVLQKAPTASQLDKVSVLPRDPSTALGMTVLNVAGPRASQWPAGHEMSHQIMSAVLRRLSGHEGVDEYSPPDSPGGEF
jgi:hypothetical protein